MVYSRDINNLNLNYTRWTVFHFSDYKYTHIWMTETHPAPEKGTRKQSKPPLYDCCEHALKENLHRVSLYFASFEVMIFWASGFQSFRKPSLACYQIQILCLSHQLCPSLDQTAHKLSPLKMRRDIYHVGEIVVWQSPNPSLSISVVMRALNAGSKPSQFYKLTFLSFDNSKFLSLQLL